MKLEEVAKVLKELGHPTRLNIFKILVKSGHNGLPVGTLAKKLNVPNSTITHHISGLVQGGLVEQQRDGRILYCVPQYDMLEEVILFLNDECCIEESLLDCK